MLFSFITQSLANTISDKSYVITTFSSKQRFEQFQNNQDNKNDNGIFITLKDDSIHNEIKVVFPDQSSVPFRKVIDYLRARLLSDLQIFPLFLDYEGDNDNISNTLKNYNLLDFVITKQNNSFPNLNDLRKQNKKLLIFNYSNKSTSNPYIFSYNEHVFDYPHNVANFRNSQEAIQFCTENQEFLSIKRFLPPYILKHPIDEDHLNMNTSTFLLDYVVGCWNNTGQKPNFIFNSLGISTSQVYALHKLLEDLSIVKVNIIDNSLHLNQISWIHSDESLTKGKVSFPLAEGEELDLIPYLSGYTFKPYQIKVDHQHLVEPLLFEGRTQSLSDGLCAYYMFNGNLKNEISPYQRHLGGIFVEDAQRSQVLRIENKSYIKLSSAEEYNIVNNSFTMAIKFKLNTDNLLKDNCIIGNNQKIYRKGLHVNIREGIPYFGFFTNDVRTKDTIKASQWYHIAVRYNIDNGEQSIFLDGEKVAQSFNHPSFIGKDTLQLGYGIRMNNYFSGYLDDLIIWDRALSDAEIATLEHKHIDIYSLERENKLRFGIGLGLIIILLLLIRLWFKKRQDFNKPKLLKVISKIELLGGFKVYNINNEDITKHFSPKTKEIFLLLLFSSIKNPTGISKNELTEIIWPEINDSKVSNSRSVAFNRLKKTLNLLEGIELIYENEFWKFNISPNVACDYKKIFMLLQDPNANLKQFIPLLKNGKFLALIKKDWLLDFRTSFNFELIDTLLRLINDKESSEDIILVCNYILDIDDQNQIALYHLLHHLHLVEQTHKANFIFESFTTTYLKVNNTNFPYSQEKFLDLDAKEELA